MTPPQKIKQWLTGQDGLDKLRMDEAECPAPGEDEVLVEVHSVSLNYRDTDNAKNVDSRYGPLQPPLVGRSSSRDCSG
jgi:NADPH:quinone reductase-like Zn-dependent oxidoreductase